jgi:hypothetical protein
VIHRSCWLAFAIACGGGHSLPVCPDGKCTLPGNTVVKWVFDSYPDRGFQMDSCTDLRVSKVQVDLTDTAGTVTSKIENCDNAQATFLGLPPGNYTIAITPTDSGGGSLVGAPIAGMVTAASDGDDVMVSIPVPWTAWTGSYTGTFLFRLAWGGASCSDAHPEVKTQILKLMVNGQLVMEITSTGHHVDGNDPEPCYALSEQFPQSVLTVPFGPATLMVEGKDQGNAMKYMKSFDTFVGAGISNPTLMFDTPAPMVDAGIDAPTLDASIPHD